MKVYVKSEPKYYKNIYKDFVQPSISANGTLGGTSFACSSSSNMANYPAWKALDKGSTTEWRGADAVADFIFYNPIPLCVTKLSLVQFTGSAYQYWSTSGNVYGSNNNNDWELLTSYTNDVKDFEIDLSSNKKFYNYYKIESLTAIYRFAISELTITAYEETIVATLESTADDYDYIVKENEYYIPATSNHRYYKYEYCDYVQPTNPTGITSSSGFLNPANAFDGSSSTYAACGTQTDYIEWNIGETIIIEGFSATTNYVDSVARACNVSIYMVNGNGEEILLANGSGVPAKKSGTSTASFDPVKVSTLRFKVIAADGGNNPTTSYKSRVTEIKLVITDKIVVNGTEQNHDFYEKGYICKGIIS